MEKRDSICIYLVYHTSLHLSRDSTFCICSDLTQRRFRREGRQTLVERVERLGDPGPKQTGKSHACVTAFGRACPTTYLASDDQRPNASFGEMVVCRNPRHSHQDKEFRQKALDSLTQRMLRGSSAQVRLANQPELLLKSLLLLLAPLLLLRRRESRIRARLRPFHCSLIDGFDRGGPGKKSLIMRMFVFEFMGIA